MAVFPSPPDDDPLEYLVRISFPLERHYRTVFPITATNRSTASDEQYLKQASAYRKELKKLSKDELIDRAEGAAKAEAEKAVAKREAEEAQRFFNLPNANADVAHWMRMSVWTLDQAVALSLGKDPRRVNWDNIKSQVKISAFAAAYQARRDIIFSAKQAGQLTEPTIPGVLIAWAERLGVEFPASLVEAVKALGIQIADWKTAYERQKLIAEAAQADALAEKKAGIQASAEHLAYIQKLGADYRAIIEADRAKIANLELSLAKSLEAARQAPAPLQPPAEKSLGARERESLLKLVIGMAIRGYRYDPKASRSDVVTEIAGDLSREGVPLDADTVRKFLREARNLLPRDETEPKC